jgi:hypothetical protein
MVFSTILTAIPRIDTDPNRIIDSNVVQHMNFGLIFH